MARRIVRKSSLAPDADTRILAPHGPDDVRRRDALTQLHSAMETAFGLVDLLCLDGQSCQLYEVFDELRSFGLMQQYKIVIVDNADSFITTHRSAIEHYAAKPVAHATLVLRCARWYKGNLDKLINKFGCIIKCEPYTPQQIMPRLIEYAQEKNNRCLSSPAATLLIERMGAHMLALQNEVDKLSMLVGDGGAIEPALIEQVVARSSDEQAWVVQEAILEGLGRRGVSIRKIHELVDLSQQAEGLVAYCVADLIRKLHLGLMLKKQGAPAGQIAKEMKLWGPRLTVFMTALTRINEQQIGTLLSRVVQADRRAKSGFGKSLRNIECFCALLDDELLK